MKRIMLGILALTLLWITTPILESQQSKEQASEPATPSMPSQEEVNDLLSKASEYVTAYEATFKTSKETLDKSPAPGYFEKSTVLTSQASTVITAIKKNGMSAYALVTLVGVLDDMSLNAARASEVVVITGLQTSSPVLKHSAIQDMQDLSQAGKNCYDISELILHATLRYIAFEEDFLKTIFEQQKSASPAPK
jgi:hypothetical protein